MSKRPRMPFPRPLSGVAQECLAGFGLSDRLREAEIWRFWPDVVGEAIASRAQPVRIINGILTVAVSSAPWMQELRFMTGIMKEKLNSRLGGDVVREIMLKSGRVEPPPVEAPEIPVKALPLTSSQMAMIEEQSARIEDPETRLAFIELMKTSLQYPR